MAKFETKYFIDNKSLKDYCADNDYSYSSARQIISNIKTKEANKNITNDDLMKLVVNSLEKGRTQYFYKGMSLSKYCKINKIDHTCVRKRIRKLKTLKENEKLTDEEITTKAIDLVLKDNIKYYIGEQRLSDFCEANEINYSSIIGGINNYKKKPKAIKLSDNEIAQLVVNRYLPKNTLYYVGGKSLTEYCQEFKKSKSTVIRKLNELTPDKPKERKIINIPLDVIEYIFRTIKPKNGTQYYFDNQTLRNFCLEKGIGYEQIITEINDKKKLNIEFSIDEIVNRSIFRKEFKDKIKDKQRLKVEQNNLEYIKEYCHKNNINLEEVIGINKSGYSFYLAINMIYYCGDTITVDGKKGISINKIQELESLYHQEEKTLDDLLLLQGIGFTGLELEIVKHLEGFVVNILNNNNVTRHFFGEYKEYFEELIINTLNNDFTLGPGQFIKYLQKQLKGKLMQKFYQNNLISSSEADYEILDPNSIYDIEEDYIEEERKESVQQALTSLNDFERLFIVRKYGFQGKPLTLSELKEDYYLEYSISDLEAIDQNILIKLSENDNIKLIKSLN